MPNSEINPHHTITNFFLTLNLYRVKPFVKISACCCFVSIWQMSMLLSWVLDLNQWYLIPICFVREVIKEPLLLAKFRFLHCLLKHLTLEISISNPNSSALLIAKLIFLLILIHAFLEIRLCTLLLELIAQSQTIVWNSNRWARLQNWVGLLVYSLHSLDPFSLLKQRTQRNQRLQTNPIWDPSLRYLTMCFTPISCEALSWCENLAHWCTA